MSIKSKLIVTLSVILVSAFLTTSFINYAITRRAIRSELIQSSLPLTRKNIYSEIQGFMMRPLLVSSSMANDTFLRNWITGGEKDLDAITKYLQKIKKKYGFFTTFFVSKTTDLYYTQNGILKEIGPRNPHDIWYYAFQRSGKEFDLDVDNNEAENNTLTIFINFRVDDAKGRFLGVAGVGVNIENAAKMLREFKRKYNRKIFLVDEDGLVQLHHDKHLIEKHSIAKAGGISELAPQILHEKDDILSLEYNWNDTHYLLSTQYIPELQWHLIVEQSEDEALASARENLVRTIIIGLCASTLIIVLCIFTVNHYQKRLERLAQTDPLTGVANRRALESYFQQAAYKAKRYAAPFSTIILDLNKFKEVNDQYGHLKGDEVLKYVATTLSNTLRPTDILARWGGDEFIIFLDGTLDDAHVLAQRTLLAVTESSDECPISFSYGLAQYRDGDDLESITKRADTELYQAKDRSRSKTV
ncbi:diguanylate cyclase [Pseudodesulfovibrio sp. JC047]|uniref:sensor domain-containing diguanylate cyclase n=1 Tax=Pseudodesulfovibrio sp. JC047 TaxID=2683199 RepID=UPI0013D7D94E|nr:sensor domain-containing diguanylate cyclase [Pseudodesulfovibrio sp. JC047]NDV20753.1 diguanylate cyclase [Pseudodesulfovibrio sp. JC047]